MSTDDVLQRYRRQLVDWSEAHHDPERANTLFRANHATYKVLRETDEGRTGIEKLTGDVVTAVRLMAAVHCLPWASEIGVPVLETLELRDGDFAIDAKYSLIAYRDGSLNLDW
ncbi:hypothetical protein [Cellulomonas terrae]|uniref:Uncharacterized protein n=1 Tax=Cellulomonas terrae TaxID=311234 RepID=A0A511JN34_9CELL|nr:hypothetical protein [Cellulomonas terrae]GEL99388.1 hypothetical protein CTE05_29350 [Cellulomonas terrae]